LTVQPGTGSAKTSEAYLVVNHSMAEAYSDSRMVGLPRSGKRHKSIV